jgi:protein SCO1/2
MTRVLLPLAMTLAAACGPASRPPGDGVATAPPSAAAEIAPSLYDLDVELTDQQGRETNLATLRGRPVVAAMVYTSCTTVCPRITADMRRLETHLAEGGRDDVQLVLFSLDPERDTSEALRRFAATHRLTSQRWRLFATSEDGVRELAAALGVRYAQEPGGEIAHSAMIFAIDRSGVVVHRQVGLNHDLSALTRALEPEGRIW